jgi:hypothetical protein
LFLCDVFHRFGFFGDHVGNHRRPDCPRAHRINADASGGVFKIAQSRRVWLRDRSPGQECRLGRR